ncbi:MAG TPA: hypothetical protein DEG17_13490 [Cyanobacteria bacterium UBA11149]|nr:hypothetical protein [Cyanobacteria bacterium UBA11367]HBE60862.1 hypothetical protein [Cyanobacteria bacterium UBA11366]HBK63749.1 hypothetical protein [Cyanobacteria bacterium UBA11166]HBR74565.1 hypothetical protein [Cyanobacteria bacterium UBA11159]HBS68637.1 hypothetical protein [Cyanobacteria bacterium UBA11153]HBW89855.1 hypothetical protein [Cyanobacteria bacterium UBA11149]HCA93647.1 hypothetical protein [Cyanobacteria bacterium UBA9226]
MSRDITPEVDYHHISLFNRKFDAPNLRGFSPGEGGIGKSCLILDRKQSISPDCSYLLPQIDISPILPKLQLCQPISTCPHQHQLASQALMSLRQRRQEDFNIMLSQLAADVANTVD